MSSAPIVRTVALYYGFRLLWFRFFILYLFCIVLICYAVPTCASLYLYSLLSCFTFYTLLLYEFVHC